MHYSLTQITPHMIYNCAPKMFLVCQELCTECLFAYSYNKVYFCDDRSTLHTLQHREWGFLLTSACMLLSTCPFFTLRGKGEHELHLTGIKRQVFALQEKSMYLESNFDSTRLSSVI